MHQGGQPGSQHHAQPLLLPHHPLHHDSVPDCVLGGGGGLPVQRWHHHCQDDHSFLLHCSHHLGESPLSMSDTCVVNHPINQYVFNVLGCNWDPTDTKFSEIIQTDLLPTCTAFPVSCSLCFGVSHHMPCILCLVFSHSQPQWICVQSGTDICCVYHQSSAKSATELSRAQQHSSSYATVHVN